MKAETIKGLLALRKATLDVLWPDEKYPFGHEDPCEFNIFECYRDALKALRTEAFLLGWTTKDGDINRRKSAGWDEAGVLSNCIHATIHQDDYLERPADWAYEQAMYLRPLCLAWVARERDLHERYGV